MSTITLTDEQKSIIHDPDMTSDTLIIAGAGSGKTFTMTNRIIELIRRGVRPDQILGLTFTKKATAELNQRVLAALPAGEHTHPQVSTYDSFFQSIVRRYGILIGADPTAQPLSGAGRRQLAWSVVSDHMDEIFARLNRTDPLQRTVDPVHQPAAQSIELSQLADKLIAFENECLSYMIDEHRTSFADAIHASRAWNDELIGTLRTLLSDAREKYPDEYDKIVEGKKPSVSAPPIDGTGSQAKGARAAEKSAQKKQEGWDHYRIKAQIAHGYSLYRTALRRSIVMDLAQDFYDLKRDDHLAEFSDFPAYALQLLSRFPSIGTEYRSRYKFVFLDEYQDTSTTQARLLALLFHASSTDRSVVTAVGDPFQSIYGWRGASPSAFALFANDFEIPTSRIKTLSATVRNRPLVLGVANHVTDVLRNPALLRRASVSPASDDAFEQQTHVKKLTVLPRRSADHKPDATISVMAFLNTAQEARAVAQFAVSHVQSHPGQQVAILLRSSTHFDDFRRAVQARGLTCQVVGREDPRTSPEARDLLSALRAVADPTDSTPLMRLLASARYGLSAHDLQALAQAATHENETHQYQALVAAGIARGDEDEKTRHDLIVANRDKLPATISVVDVLLSEQCHEILAALPPSQALSERAMTSVLDLSRILRTIERTSTDSVQECVRTAISALGLEGDLSVASSLRDQSDRPVPTRSQISSNLDVLLDQVDTYVSELPPSLAPSLGGFVTWLDSLAAEDISADAPDQHDFAGSDVVIMTVHQAKGLEWPAVAVAGVNDGSFPSTDSVQIRGPQSAEGENGHVMTISPEVWIENDASVPAPLRSDAFVLPAFPHGVQRGNGADPIGDVRRLTSLRQIDEEVFAPAATAILSPDDTSTHSIVPEFPSLEERYGERAWADEMRIAYVAVTRTSGDLMVSGVPRSLSSKKCEDLFAPATQMCDDEQSVNVAAHLLESVLSPLWHIIARGVQTSASRSGQSVQYIRLARSSRAVRGIDQAKDRQLKRQISHLSQLPGWAGRCCDQDLEPQIEMIGLCAGENAQHTADEWNADLGYQTAAQMAKDAVGQSGQLVWPAHIDPDIQRVLAQSADAVRHRMADLSQRLEQADSRHEKDSQPKEGQPKDGPLTALVKRLAEQEAASREISTALSAQQSGSKHISTDELEERARRALHGKSISATRLQKLLMPANEEAQRKALVEIVRPMPQPPNLVAQKGTIFHAWVADQLNPAKGEAGEETVSPISGISGPEALSVSSSADAHLLERLAQIESDPNNPDARVFRYWQNAFTHSVWAHRSVLGVEQQFALSLAGHRVPARLDAIFRGRLHDLPGHETPGTYTIIDWKTGFPPHSHRDEEDKLFQLRIYRLAFTHAFSIDPHYVDAALFYVSARDAAHQLYELKDYQSLAQVTSQLEGNSHLLDVMRSDFENEE